MSKEDQELMERYIYQVVRRLPKAQQKEVGMELQELISDMMEQTGSMEQVLEELGDPAEFAKSYRDDGHCLIGPEYYDTYLWFMKVVLCCALISTMVVTLLNEIGGGDIGSNGSYLKIVINKTVSFFSNGITNSLVACMEAFGIVTFVFAVMERQKVKLERKNVEKVRMNAPESISWNPKHLTAVPNKKAIINRGDSIVSIVFIIFFCALLIASPNIFSMVIRLSEDFHDVSVIPVFNPGQWNRILPLFILGLFAALVDEILKLIMGVYCRTVMISCIVSGFVQIIAGSIILKVLPIWNPDLVYMLEGPSMEGNAGIRFLREWILDGNSAFMSNVILACIIIGTLAEIGVTIYKTVRYGTGVEKN